MPPTLQRLGLAQTRPTLVLVGGAGGLTRDDRDRLLPIFEQTPVPVVATVAGAVVDGGTDSGVMGLVGHASAGAGGVFPLVGVAAVGTVTLPGSGAAPGTAPLEPHHSHFLLVPGDEWGDESPWLSLVATVLAGPHPSVTVLVNGGETAWRDVEASVAARRPVIVVEGSGRAADDIASALLGGRGGDRGDPLATSGLVEAVPLDGGAGALAGAVQARLGRRSGD